MVEKNLDLADRHLPVVSGKGVRGSKVSSVVRKRRDTSELVGITENPADSITEIPHF
jgi:serine phosphatase RsbU (regulator of sigma subunit)